MKLAELHVHLRGTATPELVGALAKRNGVQVSAPAASDRFIWSDFAGFLQSYHEVGSVFLTAEDYQDVALDYLIRSATDGCIYAELMVSPDHAADRGILYGELIDAIGSAISKARELTGIEASIVITAVRHRGPEAAFNLATLVAENGNDMVVGFGLAGDEQKFRPAAFAPAFAVARESGLGTTAHAGEFCGPEEISETIEQLRVARLGHGVRAIEDSTLVQHIAKQGIVLEVCPTSNFKLGVYNDPAAHPFRALMDADCIVTLNTDDPAHFDGSLRQEYLDAQQNFDLSNQDLRELTKNAVNGAFCSQSLKTKLMLALEDNNAYT